MTVPQPTARPTNKVVAAAVVTLIAFVAALFDIEVAGAVDEAIVTLTALALAYFVRDEAN